VPGPGSAPDRGHGASAGPPGHTTAGPFKLEYGEPAAWLHCPGRTVALMGTGRCSSCAGTQSLQVVSMPVGFSGSRTPATAASGNPTVLIQVALVVCHQTHHVGCVVTWLPFRCVDSEVLRGFPPMMTPQDGPAQPPRSVRVALRLLLPVALSGSGTVALLLVLLVCPHGQLPASVSHAIVPVPIKTPVALHSGG
jgi:hypothetical protein